MAAKDFQELIKAQMETTRALLSAEEAKRYDTIISEKQLQFDKNNEKARKAAETRSANAAKKAENGAETIADVIVDSVEKPIAQLGPTVTKGLENLREEQKAAKKIAGGAFKSDKKYQDVTQEINKLEGIQVTQGLKGASLLQAQVALLGNNLGEFASDNKEYQKKNYEAKQAELAERLKNATSASGKKEIKAEQRALAAKQEGLLGKIAGGINSLRDGAKEKLKSAGKGVMNLIKGFFIAGFAIALITFLNSPLWEETKTYIVSLIPKLKDFYKNTLVPLGQNLLDFISDPTWKTFADIFSSEEGDEKTSIVLGLAAITLLLTPSLLLAGLSLGVGLFAKALNLAGLAIGTMLPTGTPKVGPPAPKVGKVGAILGKLGIALTAGLAGILRGVAFGLAAFAAGPVGIGAAVLTAAILGIGGAVAGATWMVGKSLPSFAEGMMKFQDLNSAKLMSVGKGIRAIADGIAAFGAAAAVKGIGGLVGSIGSFFGGKDKLTPLEQLKIFSETPINAVQATSNANALVSYSKAMEAGSVGGQAAAGIGSFIGGALSGLTGFFGADSPLEKLQKFGEMDINAKGVMINSKAVAEYAKAMSILSGDITGVDLINSQRANQVNQAGLNRSSGGGGAPIVIDAKSTNVVNSNSTSSATFTSKSLTHPNALVTALNYAH